MSDHVANIQITEHRDQNGEPMTALDKALLAHYGHEPTCDLIATECHPECNCRCTCGASS